MPNGEEIRIIIMLSAKEGENSTLHNCLTAWWKWNGPNKQTAQLWKMFQMRPKISGPSKSWTGTCKFRPTRADQIFSTKIIQRATFSLYIYIYRMSLTRIYLIFSICRRSSYFFFNKNKWRRIYLSKKQKAKPMNLH